MEDERFLDKIKANVPKEGEEEKAGVKGLIGEIESEMIKAAQGLKFERAAFLRDKIKE